MLSVIKNLTGRIDKEKSRLIHLSDCILHLQDELDGLPHAQTKSGLERLVAAKIDCENLISRLSEIRRQCQAEFIILADQTIDNEVWRKVVICRYAFCLSFKKIAAELGYSLPHIFKMHRQATRQLFLSLNADGRNVL